MSIKFLVRQSGQPDRTVVVQECPFGIGSDRANDLVLHDPGVHSFHAKVLQKEDQFFLVDMGPARSIGITEPGEVAARSQYSLIVPGQSFQIGNVQLEAVPVGHSAPEAVGAAEAQGSKGLLEELYAKPQTAGVRLDAIALRKSSFPIFGATMLDNLHFTILPGEFVVVAGVSGGGKSTLLNALSGQKPAAGRVLFDGIPLYSNLKAFQSRIGHVPQDDVVHLDLSVREALVYATRLRMPGSSYRDRQRQVQNVLEELNLTHRQHVQIKRLSGGQRKRVSIGVELVANPDILFLDEATSGLDPGTEAQIMQLLRRLAKQGKTIVLITHATKNVGIADRVLFLAKGGRLAFFGASYEALNYFKVRDFDGIYSRVECELTPEQWRDRYQGSSYAASYMSDRKAGVPKATSVVPGKQVPGWHQFKTLCHRNLKLLLKDPLSLFLMLFTAPALGALNFLLWKRDIFSPETGNAGQAITMLFTVVVMATMAGVLASLSEIAKETHIFNRESKAGMGVLPYIASKLQLCLLLALYQSSVLLWSLLHAVELHLGQEAIAGMGIALFLASFGSTVLGLLVSALAPNQAIASLIAIMVLVPQIVFGGGLLPPSQFNDSGKLANQMSLTKYPFESLITLSGLGKDVAEDRCWSRPTDELRSLSDEQQSTCGCYGPNLTNQCKFPGIRKANDPTPQVGLIKGRMLIQQIKQGYGAAFAVSLHEHRLASVAIVVVTVALLLGIQYVKAA